MATPSRVVLFLDIDGVLAPFPPSFVVAKGRIFPDDTVAALSSILEAFTDERDGVRIEIVLSSTWRVRPSYCRDILHDFSAYGRGPLADLVDFDGMTDPALHTERQHEIDDWLIRQKQQHQQQQNNNNDSSTTTTLTNQSKISAWVCLDDEDLIHGEVNALRKSFFEGHVIHCDSKKGLTSDQASEAIQLIRHQLSQL